jgi:glycosyltransferase involved in cell wall biosynthesis
VAELSNRFPEAEITFVDASPDSRKQSPICITGNEGRVTRKTCRYPTKNTRTAERVLAKIRQEYFKVAFRVSGTPDVRAISTIAPYLRKAIGSGEWDLIVGHNIDTLPVVCEIGRMSGAKTIFDCMEFYSDMGDGQSPLSSRAIRALEAMYLPRCDCVVASSPEVAEALEQRYGLASVVPVYNAASVMSTLAARLDDGKFHLYWRNAAVGMSQRGLGDALEALTFLPEDVVLNVQGRPGRRVSAVHDRVAALGLEDRVIFHEAYPLGDAVLSASRFAIGLCPERDTCLNQRLTVSNKIFDYLTAGLAVVSSDLPGLSAVVSASGAGMVHRAGDPRDLADNIRRLHEDRDLLRRLQDNARGYAESQVNESTELERFGRMIVSMGCESSRRAA